MTKPKKLKRRCCYFCARRRLAHLMKRETLAGPASRRVYVCRDWCRNA